MKSIHKAIQKLGTEIHINGKIGMAVIYPVRYTQKENGGEKTTSCGISDPHRYFCYTDAELMSGSEYGDIVTDSENEYYVLWTDEVKSRFGNYAKACMRKVERSE